MIKLKDLLNEMPTIQRKGKGLYANDISLKDLKIEDVRENIVIIRQREKGGFVQYGWTIVYFMDSKESAEAMAKGEIPYLMIPVGTFHSGGSPITDVWKKRFQKPGHEHILGLIQGHSDEENIYLDMVSVRPKYKRQTIASKMVDALKQNYPNAKITHSSATDQGQAFLKTKGWYSPQQPQT